MTRSYAPPAKQLDQTLLEKIAGLGPGSVLVSRSSCSGTADLSQLDGGGLLNWREKGSHPSLTSATSDSTVIGLKLGAFNVNAPDGLSNNFGASPTDGQPGERRTLVLSDDGLKRSTDRCECTVYGSSKNVKLNALLGFQGFMPFH